MKEIWRHRLVVAVAGIGLVGVIGLPAASAAPAGADAPYASRASSAWAASGGSNRTTGATGTTNTSGAAVAATPTFKDTASSPFRVEIDWLASTGISTGYPDGTFRPLNSVNRDAMAAFLYRFAVKFADEPEWTPPDGPSPFSDVAKNNQFYKEITWLAAKGITTGYPDGTFRPLSAVNRDATAAFLSRVAVKFFHEPPWTPPATSPFSDVPKGSQFYSEITWLRSARITTGYANGTFQPVTPVSREAMAAFLYRFAHPAPRFDLTRGSVAGNAVQGNSWSESSAVSGDGRYLVFTSGASNLVAGDTNGVGDVFRRDLQTGTTVLVSTSTAGVPGNALSALPAISSDGRYVAFVSTATNLVDGDTNAEGDVFLRDMTDNVTTRVSVTGAGAQGNGSSWLTNIPTTVAISADGRYVAFASAATNLVPGDTNGALDVFVRDVQGALTSRVSLSTANAQGNDDSLLPAFSADGTRVGFTSFASNLVAGDTNGAPDVFVRVLATPTTSRVSVGAAGAQGTDSSFETSLSADGRYVVFSSDAPNLVPGDTNGVSDVFVRDTQDATTTRVSVATSGGQANEQAFEGVISADGRYVVFTSEATNLVPGDLNAVGDVFVRDRTAGSTGLVSARLDGTQGDGESYLAAVSANGGVISFSSEATNLVTGDTNRQSDIFVATKR